MAALYGFAYARRALDYLEKAVPAKVRGQIKRRIENACRRPTQLSAVPTTNKRVGFVVL
jgi:hypothetical protein